MKRRCRDIGPQEILYNLDYEVFFKASPAKLGRQNPCTSPLSS